MAIFLRLFISISLIASIIYFSGNYHNQVHTIQNQINQSNALNKVTPESKLKYFGYYLADDTSIGVGKPEYIDEINSLHNSNVVEIYAKMDEQYMFYFLSRFQKYNLKAIIDVDRIFFDNLNGGKYNQAILKSNWNDNWKAFKNIISGFENNIYAFYFDEPYWNGISESDFRKVTFLIKNDFPQIDIMDVEADPPIANKLVPLDYLEYVDDYGFDYYFFISTQDKNHFLDSYNKMMSIAKNKKIWLLVDGYITDKTKKDSLLNSLNYYYNFALNHRGVSGLITFVYSDNIPDFTITIRNTAYDITSKYFDKNLHEAEVRIGKRIVQD